MRTKFICVIMALFATPVVGAIQAPLVDRIEEDWELVVGEPSPEIDAPQITTSMIPFSTAPGLNLQVNLNHALKPDFNAGGIQVRVVQEDEMLGQIHRHAGEKLSQINETVRWTKAVQRVPNGYSFGVSTGTGDAWGTFGGNEYFLVIPDSLAAGGLDHYDYQLSLDNSTVAYAGNRVQSLKLMRIRIFYSNGQAVEQEVFKDVNTVN